MSGNSYSADGVNLQISRNFYSPPGRGRALSYPYSSFDNIFHQIKAVGREEKRLSTQYVFSRTPTVPLTLNEVKTTWTLWLH